MALARRAAPPTPHRSLTCSQGSLAGPAPSSPSGWNHLALTLSPQQTPVLSLPSVSVKTLLLPDLFIFFPENSSFLLAPSHLYLFHAWFFLHSSYLPFLPQPSLSTSFGNSSPRSTPFCPPPHCPIRETISLPHMTRNQREQKYWDTGRIEI